MADQSQSVMTILTSAEKLGGTISGVFPEIDLATVSTRLDDFEKLVAYPTSFFVNSDGDKRTLVLTTNKGGTVGVSTSVNIIATFNIDMSGGDFKLISYTLERTSLDSKNAGLPLNVPVESYLRGGGGTVTEGVALERWGSVRKLSGRNPTFTRYESTMSNLVQGSPIPWRVVDAEYGKNST